MVPEISDRVILEVIENEERMLEELLDPPLPLDDWECLERIVLLSAAQSCDFKWSDVSTVLQEQCPRLDFERPDGWYSPYACKQQFDQMVEKDMSAAVSE